MGGDLDVRVLLTAHADQMTRTLKNAGGDIQRFGQNLGERMSAAGASMRGFGRQMSLSVTAPIAAAVTGLGALTKSVASRWDEIAKAARSIGADAGAFQELRFAISQAISVSEGEFQRALENLNRNMGDLASGGASDELAAAFRRIGISAEDNASGTVDVTEAFTRINEHLGSTGSAAEAAATGAELLGSRVGRSLGPQLRAGGDQIAALRDQASDLGLVLSKDALDAAEAFSDQNSIVNKQFRAMGDVIGGQLLPILVNDLMPVLIETVVPGIAKVVSGIGDAIKWFRDLSPEVKTTAGIVAAALGVGGPILIALGALTTAVVALASPAGAVLLAIAALGAAWVAWGDDIRSAVSGTITWLQETFLAFGEWWNEFWNNFFSLFGETFSAGFAFITEATTAVTDFFVGRWQWISDTVVGDSIVPDMWDMMKAEWRQGSQEIAGMSQGVAAATTQSFASMAKGAARHMQSMFQAFSQHSKAMFIASQAAGIAQALIATYQGIAEALKLAGRSGRSQLRRSPPSASPRSRRSAPSPSRVVALVARPARSPADPRTRSWRRARRRRRRRPPRAGRATRPTASRSASTSRATVASSRARKSRGSSSKSTKRSTMAPVFTLRAAGGSLRL